MVSLLMIGLFTLVSLDVSIIIGNIENNNEILVFVYNDVKGAELSHIRDVIDSHEYVSKIVYRSPEEAWEMERESYSEYVRGLFDSVNEIPMPSTYIVSLNDITMTHEAAMRFEEINGVEGTYAPHDFANFLISIRTTLTIIAGAVLIALIVVCLVIIYNTARTSVFARRMQISIMKHVGATNAFIKFPFFIEGMFIGVIAGVASWYLTKLAYESVVGLFASDITILEILGLRNLVGFHEIGWYVLAANCVAGALLGAIGTVMSMGKHLKV